MSSKQFHDNHDDDCAVVVTVATDGVDYDDDYDDDYDADYDDYDYDDDYDLGKPHVQAHRVISGSAQIVTYDHAIEGFSSMIHELSIGPVLKPAERLPLAGLVTKSKGAIIIICASCATESYRLDGMG